MDKRKITGKYLLIYTALFAALCAAVFLPFALAGKSLIGNGDGQSQYILHLAYMGKWLRQTLSGFLSGNFTPALYDFTIGMGDDINAVIRFHPLDFLSVFVPESGTETLYHVLIFLRMYLAGLTFSLFAFAWKRYAADADGIAGKHHTNISAAEHAAVPGDVQEEKHAGWAVLCGCIVYIFCGYTFSLGIVHPTYLSPLVTLPLLLLGAERMMHQPEKHRFVLFSVITAVSFVSNYYFMFIASIAVFLYVFVRYFQIYRTERVKNFLLLFVRFCLAYLVGVLLSAITLFPALSRFLNSYRSEKMSAVNNLLIYADKRRYLAWLVNLISPLRASGNGTHLNFAVLALPAIVLLFFAGKKGTESVRRAEERTFLRIASLVLLAFLLIPAGGYLMAALNNENNRWVFLIALLCGGAVSFSFRDLLSLAPKAKRALLAACIVFDLCVAAAILIMGYDIYIITGAAELTAVTLILYFAGRKTGSHSETNQIAEAAVEPNTALHSENRSRSVIGNRMTAILMAVCIISTVINGFMTFGSSFGNLPQYYMDSGKSLRWYRRSVYADYDNVKNTDGFYRVDGVFTPNKEDNASLLLGYPGVQIYNSVLNASQIDYMLETQSAGITTMLHIKDLDGRSAAETLASVRYFMTDQKNAASLPYGYAKMPVWSDGKKAIFENEYPLGLSYGTDTVISRSEFDRLTGAEKEYVMLDAAVLEDQDAAEHAGSLLSADLFRERSGILTEEGVLPDESGSISYQTRPGYQCYLLLEGLMPEKADKLKVTGDGINRTLTLLTDGDTYTMQRRDYLVNLGYCEGGGSAEEAPGHAEETKDTVLTDEMRGTSGNSSVTLALESGSGNAGYKIDHVRFIYIPMSEYAGKVQQLNAYGPADLTIRKNQVTCTVDRTKPGIQIFSIPYSKGWSVKVNGQKEDLLKTNVSMLGVSLPKGVSSVELTYMTPGLRPGILCSIAGLILMLGAVLIFRKRNAAKR